MSNEAFRTNNHYVPGMYLSRWSSDGDRLWAYRLLVSHESIDKWKNPAISRTASHDYLYAQTAFGPWSDSLEKWLGDEFESPAAEALEKVARNAPLTSTDWERLIYFLAAQDVRTPARLVENLARWDKEVPELLESTLSELVTHLENKTLPKPSTDSGQLKNDPAFPIRVIQRPVEGSDMVELGIETIPGRSMWLFSIRHSLTSTVRALLNNQWTILRAPPGIRWVTSDNPVVRLNYYGPKYDLKGGWGNPGTEILLPLTPTHAMYTKVGSRPPPRYSYVADWLASAFQRFFCENAHRQIFAWKQDPAAESLRPRRVSLEDYMHEQQQWRDWHEANIREEQLLLSKPPLME